MVIKNNNRLIEDVFNLFYPRLCLNCGDGLIRGEDYICTKCLYKLPRTNFHKQRENIVEQLFWGKVQIEKATAFCYYQKKGILQNLILKIKYHGAKELGFMLGQEFGYDLVDSEFSKVDMIIPVPLHPKREKRRGYNQSEWIGQGIAKVIDKPVDTKILKRTVYNATQTKKGRFERWINVENIFQVIYPEKIIGKHILLVDDVITTGSTIEACLQAILKHENTKVSVAVIGVAHN